jgi:hypothetical protein
MQFQFPTLKEKHKLKQALMYEQPNNWTGYILSTKMFHFIAEFKENHKFAFCVSSYKGRKPTHSYQIFNNPNFIEKKTSLLFGFLQLVSDWSSVAAAAARVLVSINSTMQ